ncbi:(Na+)-NQR maturation NqrM [Vibrio thalassae]|uniref:(Na+)-NQR maturation NqrM n=2 Tax=Vibrio thalassae TaxID=1243014 RepID=UPI003637CFC4
MLFAILAFLTAIALMAIGVMFKRKAIQGSCGGLASAGIEGACDCKDKCESTERTLYQIPEPSKH